MRRALFTFLAAGALIAVIPVAAQARQARHHHARHHLRAHRARVRHETFTPSGSGSSSGSTSSGTTSPGTAEQSAGTVTGVGNGMMTITLNGSGSTVTGAITSATEMECEAPNTAQNPDQATSGNGDGNNGDGNNGNASSGRDGGEHGDFVAHDSHGDNGNGDEPGANGTDEQGEQDEQGANAAMCPAVTPGMMVREATLTLSSAGATWDRVDLISQS
jgi:hypothetical protein